MGDARSWGVGLGDKTGAEAFSRGIFSGLRPSCFKGATDGFWIGLGDNFGAGGKTAGGGAAADTVFPGTNDCGGGLCFCGEKPGEVGAFVGWRGG